MNAELIEAALKWREAGACVIPIGTSKAPAFTWKQYQSKLPTVMEVAEWATTHPGIGIVCGAVSGNLEMLEAEAAAVGEGQHVAFLDTLESISADLATKMRTYMERSPSGGVHFLYRVDSPVPGNHPLARRRKIEDKTKISVLWETRGEGGFTVIAPSSGACHPSGRPWQIVAGEPGGIATLTAEEHSLVMAVAANFDDMPPEIEIDHRPPLLLRNSDALAPGQDYEQKTDWLRDLLLPDGWTVAGRRGDKTLVTRPGKSVTEGASATINYDGNNNLYVFTTSTELEVGSYTKFGYYTFTRHGGDWKAAATALKSAGYGAQAEAKATKVEIGEPVAEPPETPVVPLAGQGEGNPSATSAVLSEDAHGQLLITFYGSVIRYCVERGKWYSWDGARWQIQWPEGMVREYAKRVARALPDETKEQIRYKQRCLSAMGTSGALRQAQVDPRVVVSINDFDSYAHEMNTPGGVLDMKAGALRPHDPSHMHTRMTLVTPDFNARATRWEEFLSETFGGDVDLIAFVQKMVGYSLVGEVLEHVLPFCFGTGGNGKGVFLETVMALAGDYAQAAPANFLMSGQSRHETEIAQLAGARMVVCSELNDEDRFDEAKVKMLTGGDALRGRFMHKDHFQFIPSHTLWLVGNADPETHVGGRSFQRRLKKIPFDHEVEIPELGLKERLLREEGPAILAWIARGAAAYFADGLSEPTKVSVATQEYWSDQDTVGRFVAERCKLGGGDSVQIAVARFREEYENWCKREIGAEPVSAKALGMALKRIGIHSSRTMTTRFYTNITILVPENASDEEGWQTKL